MSTASLTHHSHTDDRVRVYVWELPVRVTHWLIVASVATLAFTGYYIGRPFISPGNQKFLMGTMRVIHLYAAIVFSLAVLSRVAWFFLGNRYASWKALVPLSKLRIRDMIETFKFYTFLRKEPPPTVGHNALAGAAYIAIFGLYGFFMATGFGLWAIDAPVGSPLKLLGWIPRWLGGPQVTRWLHHGAMWVLLAFVIQHVYSSILMSKVEKTGTMESIFTGNKFVKPEDLDE